MMNKMRKLLIIPHLHPEPRVGAQLDREARSPHVGDVSLTLQPSQA